MTPHPDPAHRPAAERLLAGMSRDAYFPPRLVDEVKRALLRLCDEIERQRPVDVEALYALTHAATEEINALAERFEEAGSEIETVARDEIGEAFALVARSYGYDADVEELIAPRDW